MTITIEQRLRSDQVRRHLARYVQDRNEGAFSEAVDALATAEGISREDANAALVKAFDADDTSLFGAVTQQFLVMFLQGKIDLVDLRDGELRWAKSQTFTFTHTPQ